MLSSMATFSLLKFPKGNLLSNRFPKWVEIELEKRSFLRQNRV